MNWINPTIRFLKRLLKQLSRNEWLVRLLNLPRCEGTRAEPGLVLIQIDGLSGTQFRKALSGNRAPFLRQLLSRQGFTQKPFYAGVPSSTPAVQGELFYGIRTAVPAFEFLDRLTGIRHAMFYPASARKIARRLKTKGKPLLAGGASYSNIYSGGADTARYCSESVNLQSLIESTNPLKVLTVLLLHTTSVMRIIGYAAIEMVLAVYDFFRGILKGKNFIKEVKFVPTRLIICAGLRELIRFRVKMDVTRGLPIISANFVGYDEQAHRRGPESAFAHWTIKGIDHAIRDIYRTAARSECRDYRLVVYSDHGQESVRDYAAVHEKSVKQAIRELLAHPSHSGSANPPEAVNKDNALENLHRQVAVFFPGKFFATASNPHNAHITNPNDIEITTMGPLGHIYLPADFLNPSGKESEDVPDLEQIARRLHQKARIPLVLFQKDGRIRAVNDAGSCDLEQDAAAVLGASHPFLHQAAEDLRNLCFHPDAGDLVISGWTPQGTPLTFNPENGAHGGPGTEEIRGFVILPPCMHTDLSFLRPTDLRNIILAYLEKRKMRKAAGAILKTAGRDNYLRVGTYNIHSCIHMDGRINPDRTADAIAAYKPDILALQEVDAGRKRTSGTRQGAYIAERLGLTSHFFPVLQDGDEQYGIAILSRFPVVDLKMDHLPTVGSSRFREPRGVMIAKLETPLGCLHFANLHLGLTNRERRFQIDSVLGDDRIAPLVTGNQPVIVCGDFNAGTRSYTYRKMSEHFQDVQLQAVQPNYPRATFLSRWPVMRLDHVFVSRHFRIQQVTVPNNDETRMVSDHLPVFCDLEFTQTGPNTRPGERKGHV